MIEKISKRNKKWLPIINLPLKVFIHTKKINQPIDFNRVNRVLVFFYAGIGDAVMNIPFLNVLNKNIQGVKITLVCSKVEKTVLLNQNIVDEIIDIDLSIPKSIKGLFRKKRIIRESLDKINTHHYELALEPRGDLRCIYLMRKTNADRKISYNYTGGESLLTDVVLPSEKTKHLIEDQLFLLTSIGCKYNKEDEIPYLKIYKEEKKANNDYLSKLGANGKIIIGIHPGASLEIKRWPYYPILVEKIAKTHSNIFFLIFSTKGEEAAANEILNVIMRNNYHGAVVNEKLKDYIRILASCNIIVCNDSGSAHIAAAYEIPTIVIFGPIDPESSHPVGKKGIHIVSHSLDCKPCNNTICKRMTNECIRSISTEEVYHFIESELHEIENKGD